MKKWRVVKVRKDVASGKCEERTHFQELLADMREGRVEAVERGISRIAGRRTAG